MTNLWTYLDSDQRGMALIIIVPITGVFLWLGVEKLATVIKREADNYYRAKNALLLAAERAKVTISDWDDASVTALMDAVREASDDELDRKADEYVGWLERRYEWSES